LCLLLGAPACTVSKMMVSKMINVHARNAATAEDNEQPMSTAASKAKRSQAERVEDWKRNINERMAKASEGVNKGMSNLNARVEHSVGNMMSKANSIMDDVHSAASNTLQGVKDFSDAAADPIVSKVNNGTARLNTKVKVMIGKINKAIDDMKQGTHELAAGMTRGMKEATEKVSAQLAQSVHEHVRQEIELARSAEPAS